MFIENFILEYIVIKFIIRNTEKFGLQFCRMIRNE